MDVKQNANRQNICKVSSHFALKVHVTEKSCEMNVINENYFFSFVVNDHYTIYT